MTKATFVPTTRTCAPIGVSAIWPSSQGSDQACGDYSVSGVVRVDTLLYCPDYVVQVNITADQSQVTSALEKLLTVSSTVPTMVVATPKAGTYQAASETQLRQLVGGDDGFGAEAMEVEN